MNQKKSFLSILLLSLTLFFFNAEYSHASSIVGADDVKDEIIKNIDNFKKEFFVTMKVNKNSSTLDKDIKALIESIQEEHTDTYYLMDKYTFKSSYDSKSGKSKVTFKVDYTSSAEEYKEYKEFIYDLSIQQAHLSYEGKIGFVNDYLVEKASYESSSKGDSIKNSPVSIYKSGTGTYKAYALFAYDLLNEFGIDSYLLSGTVKGAPHLWNVVKNTKFNLVHIDTALNEQSRDKRYYFMVSSKALSKTHKFSHEDLSETSKLLVATVDIKLNLPKAKKPDTTDKSPSYYAKEFIKNIDNLWHTGDLGKYDLSRGYSVRLSNHVDTSNIGPHQMFFTDASGNVVPIKVKLDGKMVSIPESSKVFKSGKTYYLVILLNVESGTKIGKYLHTSIHFKFIAK